MRKIEASIQKAVIAYCRAHPLFELAFHINNEGKKSVGQAVQDKKLGTLQGIPDICIPMPCGHTIWIELKTKRGRLSVGQKAMHARLKDRGHEVVTCYGYNEAVSFLETVERCYDHR